MTQLKVSQIKTKLRTMFEPHLSLSDIGANDPERDQKILSRCLAAHAIYLECGCSEVDAGKAVWDGADDNGIDAAYFDTAGSRVVFAQSKFINKGSGEPDAVDIGAFTKGVKDVIEQEITEFHPRLHNQLSILFQHLNNPGTSVHLVVVSTGASKLAKHGMAYIKNLLKELNGNDPDPIATAQILGLAEVYSGLATNSATKGLTLDAQLLEWSQVSSPYRAYFGMIDGLQLKQWWKDHGKKVVSGNIRHALGVTEVNTKIRSTALKEPENFWYFNNGITLVADEAAKAPGGAASRAAGNFEFKGASIVNGAQTVSTLAKVDDDTQLGKIRVPFRAILLKGTPDGFGQEVTRSNNLQNRIEPRDFVAQDPEQERLRSEMSIENVEYLYVRSEDTVSSPSSCDLVEVTTALACSSKDANLAVQVKTGVSRFYADLTKAPYKSIFNPTVSGARAFNATLVLREVDLWIDSAKANMPKKGGPGWGTLVHGNRILAAAVFYQIKEQMLAQPIMSFRTTLPSLNVPALCSMVHGKMIAAIAQHYPTRVLAVLFKNPTMSKHVYELSK
jgi:hypothetical protein